MVQLQEILDLVETTEANLPKEQWTDLEFDLQQYVAFMNIIPKRRRKKRGGKSIDRKLMMDTNQQAKHVGLYETNELQVPDAMESISIPWKFSRTYYAFDQKEFESNSGPEMIVDLVKIRRLGGVGDMVKLMERTFWGTCENSNASNKTPYGIQQWVVPNATAGLNGGNPSSHSSGIGGLSSSTYPEWSNWSDVYAAVTRDDLLDKLKEAVAKTHFVSPLSLMSEKFKQRAFSDHQIYMNFNTQRAIEKEMENLNDNLGKDALRYMNAVTIKGNPLVWVPYLDSSANFPVDSSGNTGVILDPIYLINWNKTYIVINKNKYMKKSGPKEAFHEVLVVYYDTTWNLFCEDRRRNAILYNNSGTALT